MKCECGGDMKHHDKAGEEMKHNVFDKETHSNENTLTHSDQESTAIRIGTRIFLIQRLLIMIIG